MKRIFKEFIKVHKTKIDKAKTISYASITIRFNRWVMTVVDEHKINRFHSKAHTNKHVITKWCKEMGITEKP